MSQKQSLLFFALASLVLFVVYMMGHNAQRSYLEQKEQLEVFSQEAKSLAALKTKFSDKKTFSRSIKTLTRIAPTSRDYKKSDYRVLIFDKLNANTLNNLLRKIENSTLNIKMLEINRQNMQTASVRLEIKK